MPSPRPATERPRAAAIGVGVDLDLHSAAIDGGGHEAASCAGGPHCQRVDPPRGDQMVVGPVGGAAIFAHLDAVAGGRYGALWLAPERIYDLAAEDHGDGTACLHMTGAFQSMASYRGDPAVERWIGPLPAAEIEALRAGLARRLGLPRTVLGVAPTDLARDLAGLNGRWVELTAIWSTGLERSTAAGLHLIPPTRAPVDPSGDSLRWMIGRVASALAPADKPGGRGYGAHGLLPGQLEVVAMRPPPEVSHAEARRRGPGPTGG